MWVKLHGLVVWVIRSIQWQEALDGLVGICLRRFLEEQSLPSILFERRSLHHLWTQDQVSCQLLGVHFFSFPFFKRWERFVL